MSYWIPAFAGMTLYALSGMMGGFFIKPVRVGTGTSIRRGQSRALQRRTLREHVRNKVDQVRNVGLRRTVAINIASSQVRRSRSVLEHVSNQVNEISDIRRTRSAVDIAAVEASVLGNANW